MYTSEAYPEGDERIALLKDRRHVGIVYDKDDADYICRCMNYLENELLEAFLKMPVYPETTVNMAAKVEREKAKG